MYRITLYTLNYYEDKYFISLLSHFKYTVKIYNHPNLYPDYYIKHSQRTKDKSFPN